MQQTAFHGSEGKKSKTKEKINGFLGLVCDHLSQLKQFNMLLYYRIDHFYLHLFSNSNELKFFLDYNL